MSSSQALGATPYVAPVEAPSIEQIEPLAPDHSYQAQRDADARVTIAKALVVGYLVLLAAEVVVPFIVIRLDPTPDGAGLAAVKSLTEPLGVAITSLTGILGFVLGYYFKSQEDKTRQL